jgi:hypothetical protein
VLVKSGKTSDHIGAYYFQTMPDPAVVYIPTLGGARWENWRSDWVIASTKANDRLVCRPMDRIKVLATDGLTSMHVVDDLLKRRIMPLQRRPRLCC